MSRSIFGVTVSPVAAWCTANPARFSVPLAALPRASSAFAGYVYGLRIARGDLLAVHAAARRVEAREASRAAGALRLALDTTVPYHVEPYAACAGRIVAVVTLRGCTTRPHKSCGAAVETWSQEAVREALGARPGDPWSWLVGDVIPLASPVECAGATGLWSLPADVSEAVMVQVRAVEAERAREAGR